MILPLCYSSPLLEINERSNVTSVFGDMILTPTQLHRYGNSDQSLRHLNVKETNRNRWQNNTVPYIFSSKYSDESKMKIKRAFKIFEENTCFTFKERSNENDYLYIDALDGCYSYVGKIGGQQLLSLAKDCLVDYIIWHEIMHAIGFEHEHQRPDRDRYIRIVYENVDNKQLGNFEKLNDKYVDFPDKYDYKSIMHYDGYAFGKMRNGRRLATMIPLKNGIVLNDNMMLSSLDIQKLARLGNCVSLKGKYAKSKSSCSDNNSSCPEMKKKGLCEMPFYRSMMITMCAHSCGICDPQSSHSILMEEITRESSDCQDLDERCELYVKNGFCVNRFYSSLQKVLCQKSCNLC